MKMQIEARVWFTAELPDSFGARQGQDVWGDSAQDIIHGMLFSELQRRMDAGDISFYRRSVPEPISICHVPVPPSTDTADTPPPSKA